MRALGLLLWLACGASGAGGGASGAGGGAGFLARRDRDFVGADPVLARELARRMAPAAPPPLAQPPSVFDVLRLCNEGMLPSFDCPMHEAPEKEGPGPASPAPPGSGPAASGPAGAEPARRQWSEPVPGKGIWHKFKQFPQDPNATNLYAVQLKIAEHAIYSTQAQIRAFERITARHKLDERFRLAYMTSKVDMWSNDLRIMFDYSHRNNTWKRFWIWQHHHGIWMSNTHQDGRHFSTYKHFNYYQLMLRRYLDVLYTLQMVRNTHRDLHKLFQQQLGDQQAAMPPGRR